MKLTRRLLGKMHEYATKNVLGTSRRISLNEDRGEMNEQQWVAYCWLAAIQDIQASERGSEEVEEFSILLDLVDVSGLGDDA